jgi:ABC-2 type transport system ATP-binding protein
MSEYAIVADKLLKKFDSFTAVDNISFRVKKGEIFGFLGPNGAGKTTTIRMLCGIMDPTGGKGSVGGFDIATQSEEIKEHIGYMSQKFSLYDDLTVAENIDFYAGIYQTDRRTRARKKAELLQKAELIGHERRLTANLAGSLKQHLGLACALVHDPRILFLDEPTSGVDPVFRKRIWQWLRELSAGGVTIIITTHYMLEAEDCDRLILMHKGRIAGEGSPQGLKQRTGLSSMEDIFVKLTEEQ